MLIENVDALKQWLVQKLSPICDAEPTALAKYVCALVRKDKPESELKDICNDQLDVFLQQKTKPFVDELFEGLRTKVYEAHMSKSSTPNLSASSTPLATPAVTPSATPTKVEQVPLPLKTEPLPIRTEAMSPLRTTSQPASASSSQSKVSISDSNTSIGRRGKRIEDGSQLWQPQAVKVESATENKDHRNEIRDGRDIRENREREGGRDDRERRDSDRRDIDRYETEKRDADRREPERRDLRDTRDRRRRSRSRSLSPRRGREMEERRRRYDDRGRYSPERRYSPDRRYRRRSRSRSPRRYRISPDRVRGRSRSPRERDLREKLNRHSRSWSRPRSRSRSLSRPRVGMDPDSRGSTPTQDNGHYPAVVTSNSSLPNMIAVPLNPTEPPPPGEGPPLLIPRAGGPPSGAGQARMRCQNFDEKGFCMLGDLCPFDHGMDPVVVEDIGIPNVLPFPPVPPGHPLPPPPVSLNVPPPRLGYLPPGMHLPPPGPAGDPRMMPVRPSLPPRPPLPPASDPAEGYNPEAPAMTGPPPAPQPFWTTPPPGLFPTGAKGTPPPPPLRQRDLVAVPTLIEKADDAILGSCLNEDGLTAAKERNSPPAPATRIVIPAKRTHAEMEDGATRVVQRTHFNPRHNFGHLGRKKPFDFSRLGGFNRQQFKHENVTLEVRKVPVEFNNIAKLNEHFVKFGTLTNIQVKYDGDPSAALISFSKNEEASRAYYSSEPVFNNRFIKLFWHRPSASGNGKDVAPDSAGDQIAANRPPDGTALHLGSGSHQEALDSSDSVMHAESLTEAITNTSQDSGTRFHMTNRLSFPPAQKMSLHNMSKSAPQAMSEKSIVYTTSLGNLKKTVFNQQVSRARSAVTPITSPTAVKTADFVTRIEAIKKNEELKKEAMEKKAELEKQKQVLLEKQIAQQKTLIEKLEKGKTTLLLEEKTNIMKMLKTVSDSIDKLKFSSPPTKKVSHPGSHKLVKTPAANPVSASSSNTSLQQTKKEILDTELELITKQSTGEDTSALRLRLMELTQQAASMGLLGKGRGRGRGTLPWTRGRGRGRGRAGSLTLDKRPKTLEVRGFDLAEVEEVKAHFASFGEIVQAKIKEDVPCALLTFFNRKQAEMAYALGSKFKKTTLNLHWHLGVVRAVSTESFEEPNDDEEEEETQVTINSKEEEEAEEHLLLAPDEEEEEDQESRSWRR